jgi:hypothetical protein
VTLEVMGESISWGPWNEKIKTTYKSQQTHIQYDIPWNTLGIVYIYILRNITYKLNKFSSFFHSLLILSSI